MILGVNDFTKRTQIIKEEEDLTLNAHLSPVKFPIS